MIESFDKVGSSVMLTQVHWIRLNGSYSLGLALEIYKLHLELHSSMYNLTFSTLYEMSLYYMLAGQQ